jgi:hypothetical protein
VDGRARRPDELCQRCGGEPHDYRNLSEPYVYLLGLYLGDGCISTHPRGVFRLRIVLDIRYPALVDACEAAIVHVAPKNKVHRLLRSSNYVDRPDKTHVEVSVYSKTWLCLFPQHGPGKKHERSISLAGWQKGLVARYPEALLRGLIDSDGCRFINTGRNWRHPRYSFSNLSPDIREIFCDACELLGVHWTFARPHTIYVSRKPDVARFDAFGAQKA